MKAILVALPLVVAGCVAANETPVSGPSGEQFQTAKCSGSPAACMNKAAQTCGGSYQVVDSYSKAGGAVADILPGPVTWYYMSYQCGPSDGMIPNFPHRGAGYVRPVTASCTRIGNTVNCYGM